MSLQRRSKRRIPPRARQPLDEPTVLKGMRAVAFISNILHSGTHFRTLHVLDEENREAPTIDLAPSPAAEQVTQCPGRLVAICDPRTALRCNFGLEFVSMELFD